MIILGEDASFSEIMDSEPNNHSLMGLNKKNLRVKQLNTRNLKDNPQFLLKTTQSLISGGQKKELPNGFEWNEAEWNRHIKFYKKQKKGNTKQMKIQKDGGIKIPTLNLLSITPDQMTENSNINERISNSSDSELRQYPRKSFDFPIKEGESDLNFPFNPSPVKMARSSTSLCFDEDELQNNSNRNHHTDRKNRYSIHSLNSLSHLITFREGNTNQNDNSNNNIKYPPSKKSSNPFDSMMTTESCYNEELQNHFDEYLNKSKIAHDIQGFWDILQILKKDYEDLKEVDSKNKNKINQFKKKLKIKQNTIEKLKDDLIKESKFDNFGLTFL
jgi:hypothetical protein